MKPCIIIWQGKPLATFWWEERVPVMSIPGKHRQGDALCLRVEVWIIAWYEAALLFSQVDDQWVLGDMRSVHEIRECCPGRILVGPFIPCKAPMIPRYMKTLELNEVVVTERKGVKTNDQDPVRSV